MNNEEVAVKIAEHNKEIGSLKHRVGDLEEQTQTIQSLALSIDRLANSMERMAKEQEKQGERLKKLEDEPAERWNSAKKTAFTTIVSVVAGALATGLIMILVQYI